MSGCTACAAGTYKPDAANNVCIVSDAGKLASIAAEAAQADSAATQQVSCPAATFKSVQGAVSLLSSITSGIAGHAANYGPADVSPTTDGSGVGAVLIATTDSSGVIVALAVKVSGSGYAIGDTLTIPGASLGNNNAVITLTSVTGTGGLGACEACPGNGASLAGATICQTPSGQPSSQPTMQPSGQPTGQPTSQPSGQPSSQPSKQPSGQPTVQPTMQPTRLPTTQPSSQPTMQPTGQPTSQPSHPTGQPTNQPTGHPTIYTTCHAGYGTVDNGLNVHCVWCGYLRALSRQYYVSEMPAWRLYRLHRFVAGCLQRWMVCSDG
jgi:hypothetical protein